MPTYDGVMSSAPMLKLGSPVGSGTAADALAEWLLITCENASRPCPAIRVATTLMTTGALRSRRTTTVSSSTPTRPATRRAGNSAAQ